MDEKIEQKESANNETPNLINENKMSMDEIKVTLETAVDKAVEKYGLDRIDMKNVKLPVETENGIKSKDEKNKVIRKFISEANNKGLIEGTASTGSTVATPVILSDEILRLMSETGVVRRNARIIPMESMTLKYRVTDTEAEATWEGQIIARDATSNTYIDVNFTRTNLGKTELVSNALLQDAGTDLVGHLSGVGSTSLRKAEDKACFIGNGANVTGLVNESGLNEVELAGTITQGALTYQKVLDLVNAGTYERSGQERMFMNRNTWSEIQGLEDNNGNLIMGTDNILNPNFKGVPVEMVSSMVDPLTSDGTNKCYIVYGDLKNVGFAVRNDEAVGVRVSDSAVVGNVSCWDTRQTAFAFNEDVDIKTLIPGGFSKLTSAH